MPGRLSLRLEHSFVPMNVSHVAECPDLGPECDGPVPPTPYNHHIEQFIFESWLTASLGIVDGFEVETRFGLRLVDVEPTYSELDGTEKLVPNDIHHHDETLVDPVDPWLMAKLSRKQGPVLGTFQLGLTFPLGRTEEDPYRLAHEGKWHQHLQSGTGTFMPVVGLVMSVLADPVTVSLAGLAFISAYENEKGFRAPSRIYASSRVSVSFLDGLLRPFVGIELGHESEEFWHGQAGHEGSNIRTELYGSTGIAVRLYESWMIDATVRGRMASLTDAPTFEVPVMVNLGLSTYFDLWGAPAPAAPTGPTPKVQERVEDGSLIFEKKK